MQTRRQKRLSPSSESPLQMANTTTIHHLPEDLLIHIISFLPVIDAAFTAFVCSKWRRLWLSSHILSLCIFSFASRFNHSQRSPFAIRQRFDEFASKIIRLRLRSSSPLQKFQITTDYGNLNWNSEIINYWISYAVGLKCKVLDLSLKNEGYSTSQELDPRDKYAIYPFNFSKIINSSVEVLNLHGSKFITPRSSITSLKSLYLEDHVLHESNLTKLVPLCVNLELLSVNGTDEWIDLCISSLSLKVLILSVSMKYNSFYRGMVTSLRNVTRSLEICAPNLRSMTIDSIYVGNFILRDANSLVDVCVRFSTMVTQTFHCWSHIIASLTDVERLTVDNMWSFWYKETRSHDEPDTDSDAKTMAQNKLLFCGKVSVSKKILTSDFAFNKLKYLKLLTGYRKRDVLGLGLCLEMCPKLETLVLVNVCKGNANDGLIEMSVSNPIIMEIPKLRQVSLLEYKGSRNEVHVVELLKKHNVLLENIIAFPAKEMKRRRPIIFWPSSSIYRNVTRSSKAIMG